MEPDQSTACVRPSSASRDGRRRSGRNVDPGDVNLEVPEGGSELMLIEVVVRWDDPGLKGFGR